MFIAAATATPESVRNDCCQRRDEVFVTDDNPRLENPVDICRAIMDTGLDALNLTTDTKLLPPPSTRRGGRHCSVAERARAGSDYRGHNFALDDVTVIAEHIGFEARP